MKPPVNVVLPDLPVNVVALAAGLGTRMKSKHAKVLHRAGGLTLIEHVVRAASAITTPEHITVVIGHQREQVKQQLESTGVRFAEQTEQKGTGHAVMTCRSALESQSGLVVVLYGDCPLLSPATLQELVKRQASGDSAMTLITTRLEDPTGYGRILLGKSGKVEAIVEQKAATPEQLAIQLVNPGIYCFRAELLWQHIGELTTNNPAHEYYLTDMVEILNKAGHTVAAFEVPEAGELLGINTRVELAVADKIFRDRKVRELMLDGVTVERPETVTIDADVKIGADSIVEPFARILGRSAIGEDCKIGASSIVQNSELGAGVQIAPFTSIADSRVDAGAHIGPFARLRNGNVVGAEAHIGNFVELKNTQFAAGAKANHLAYLGDSEIGEKTNIGAGTITCNYDGVKKHRTRIGKKAFVGSNSTLVAPIDIGDGSYIGAGSVITKPVPPDALALGRAHQIVKERWAAKRKKKE
ncbi:MAG TPA: bifunctional UDP-N-acetylglucosamine diphosphorylase/glucosamine-1-phosphate N-acetyltransferase GlmU [Bryobacteraceae bacterium]|nr:bifunctional UDP-N-acetylglucosamine diphosphorylase/glucosamine-1-phosphate N-acetyltransferase GlmU [Bryobacteraceae bacterium]